jgi:hypothetical protein
LYLKKNELEAPFIRSEATFEKKFKMHKLVKVIFNNDEQSIWNANFVSGQFSPVGGEKHCGINYQINKKQL